MVGGAWKLGWYREAATAGEVLAQLSLGLMYRTGRGVPRDDAEAVRWFRAVADRGFAIGQINLAFMYLDGLGVERDDAKAAALLMRAATLAVDPWEGRSGADLLIAPEMPDIDMNDWKRFDEAVTAGYEAAVAALQRPHGLFQQPATDIIGGMADAPLEAAE